MVLAKVTNENLIAGLLLRNRKFNSTDLDVYREILLEKVWGYEYYGDIRTVDVTVRRIREKIE